jgi:hypothetical protein
MTPASTPSTPGTSTYENSQFDPELPSTLDGVMKRWIVPETEEEPIERTVSLPSLTAMHVEVEGDLFPDPPPSSNEEDTEVHETSPRTSQVSFSSLSPMTRFLEYFHIPYIPYFVPLMLGVIFFVSLMINFYFVVFRSH